MTKANIESGDPMAVYKDGSPLEAFFKIAGNNIYISFLAFVMGMTFGLITTYLLLFNGIMVGAFVYFFIERGLFKESFLAIMLHGTLELSMIVMSGAAGYYLAKGLVFPGTYRRIDALMLTARSGIKIMVSVTVLLLYAAFIESFATRFTDIKSLAHGKLIIDIIRATLIAISFVLIYGYFIWLPKRRFKRGLIPAQLPNELPPAKPFHINIHVVKSIGELFIESFAIFTKKIKLIAVLSLIGSVFLLVLNIIEKPQYNNLINVWSPYLKVRSMLWIWDSYLPYSNFSAHPIFYFGVVASTLLFVLIISSEMQNAIVFHESRRHFFKQLFIGALFLVALWSLPIFFATGWSFFSMIFFTPLCLLAWWRTVSERRPYFLMLWKSLTTYFFQSLATVLGLTLMFVVLFWFAMFITNSSLVSFISRIIQSNLHSSSGVARDIPIYVQQFSVYYISFFVGSLFIISNGLLYFSLKEKLEASALLKRARQFGKISRAYGLEKETA
jgi:uncharacterized membrane protein SpoIIM required for sporulation